MIPRIIKRSMKNFLLLVLIAAIGVVCGIGLAFVQVRATSARTALLPKELEKRPPDGQPVAKPDVLMPKAVVDNGVFDFGVMDKSGRASHEFTVTNAGNAPLTLIEGSSTCKCTVVKLDRRSIMPGESTKIKVEWTAREYLGTFEQIAKIQTNDPQSPEIELKIKGLTTAILQFVPDELVLGRILAGQPASSKVELLAHANEPVEILGTECAEPDTAEFFDIAYTPLVAEELEAVPDVKGGYSITVKLKPGLPRGPFQQTIRFHTSLSAAKMVELPVKGRIGSDVSIIGPGWDKERGMLTIGMVDGGKGAKRTLRFVAHGLHRKDIKFKVTEIWPAKLLQAKLGKTTEINRGKATQTPLEIQIPKESRPANYLASRQGTPGRIVLQCNQPHVPKIIILVQFAIEGG